MKNEVRMNVHYEDYQLRAGVKPEFDSMNICEDSYNSRTDYLAAIAQTIDTLVQNEYEVRIRRELPEFTIIEYAHDNNRGNDDWGSDRLMWVTSDEEDAVRYARIRAVEDDNDEDD